MCRSTLTLPPPPECSPPQRTEQVASVEGGTSATGFTFHAIEPASTSQGTAYGTSPNFVSGATGTLISSTAGVPITTGRDAPVGVVGWTFPANASNTSTPPRTRGTSNTAIGSGVHVSSSAAGTSMATGPTSTGFIFRAPEHVTATSIGNDDAISRDTASRDIGSRSHYTQTTARTIIPRSNMGKFHLSRLSTASGRLFTSLEVVSLNVRLSRPIRCSIEKE
jgi:hypothetical protein